MNRKSISWILEFTAGLKDPNEQINCLRANDHPAVKTILQYCFNPNIKWLLPEGDPPYKPYALTDADNMLYLESKRLYLFVEGGNPNLKQSRREALFVEVLQSIDPEDAKLLLSIKDKTLPYPGLTAATVKKAFPEIF